MLLLDPLLPHQKHPSLALTLGTVNCLGITVGTAAVLMNVAGATGLPLEIVRSLVVTAVARGLMLDLPQPLHAIGTIEALHPGGEAKTNN